MQSHPLRVRGLKQVMAFMICTKAKSHPLRVRGLKPEFAHLSEQEIRSHPLRVRGLKLAFRSNRAQVENVASFTGAWIETYYVYADCAW